MKIRSKDGEGDKEAFKRVTDMDLRKCVEGKRRQFEGGIHQCEGTSLVSAGDKEFYLREETTDVKGILETNLTGSIDAFNTGDGKYNVWMRNREKEQGEGVMSLMKRMDSGGNHLQQRESGSLECESEAAKGRWQKESSVPPKPTRGWKNCTRRNWKTQWIA